MYEHSSKNEKEKSRVWFTIATALFADACRTRMRWPPLCVAHAHDSRDIQVDKHAKYNLCARVLFLRRHAFVSVIQRGAFFVLFWNVYTDSACGGRRAQCVLIVACTIWKWKVQTTEQKRRMCVKRTNSWQNGRAYTGVLFLKYQNECDLAAVRRLTWRDERTRCCDIWNAYGAQIPNESISVSIFIKNQNAAV